MDGNYDSFTNFRINIIGEICKYAKENGLDPNATLKNVAETIMLVTAIGSFEEFDAELLRYETKALFQFEGEDYGD